MKYNLDQIELILTLFQLQNSERFIIDFTRAPGDHFQDVKVKDLTLHKYKNTAGGLGNLCALSFFKNGIEYDAFYGSTVHGFYGMSNHGSITPFNPLDYISFEDKI